MIDRTCLDCGFYDPDCDCLCDPLEAWYACHLSPELSEEVFGILSGPDCNED